MPSPPTTSPADFTSHPFTHLIISGGTAGLTLAARLSSNPNLKIGILEAGSLQPPNDPRIAVPGRYGEGIGTSFDWQYGTAPQAGLHGRALPWPRGKLVGGTSALNFMTWNRPAREDLEAWAAVGAGEGWGWEKMLLYYQNSERFLPPEDANDVARHRLFYEQTSMGTDGPLRISYAREFSASHALWHDTLRGLDVETNTAHLSGSNVGAWTSVGAVDAETMTRSWATPAFYLPNAERQNLVLLPDAHVDEILLEKGEGEWVAKGVAFEHGGQAIKAFASSEVILCAGSVASPQLLELSGIGDPAVLQAAGIPAKVANANVGENLQDHIMTATIYEIDPSIPNPDTLKHDPVCCGCYKSKSGPRTILPMSLCYLPLSHFTPSAQLTAMADRAPYHTPRDRVRARRLAERQNLGQVEYIFDVGNWSTTMPASEKGDKAYATLLQILQYPFSLGSIHIDPQNPKGHPIIDPRYYANEGGALDLEAQCLGARFGERILQTPPLRDFVLKRTWPPEDLDFEDDDALRVWTRDNTVTDWHPVGTCSMGAQVGDSVVDARLRVHGVRGLRVADASVMPLQVSAHLQATVYAIAEKAAVMVLEDYEGNRSG